MIEQTERKIQPERPIRLVSPDETIEVQGRKGILGKIKIFRHFETIPVRTGLGDIFLYGTRDEWVPDTDTVGVTVHEGKLLKSTCEDMEGNRGLYYIGVAIKQGISFPPGQILHCKLDIDGIDTSFEARIHPREWDDPTPALTSYGWDAIPSDDREYAIFASPEDTALLSSFGFSFYTKQKQPEAS